MIPDIQEVHGSKWQEHPGTLATNIWAAAQQELTQLCFWPFQVSSNLAAGDGCWDHMNIYMSEEEGKESGKEHENTA